MDPIGIGPDDVGAELRPRLAQGFEVLQTLIRARLRGVDDAACRRHLNWLFDMVTALGLLQRRVGAGGGVDFAEYLIEASAYWRRVLDSRRIDIVVTAGDARLNADEASTLALIAHELIGNCVEHAFPTDEAHGRIELTLSELGGGWREFVVADTGRSASQDLTPQEGRGLELVRSLAEHLRGAFSISGGGGGVVARVRFPTPGAEARRH